MKNNKDDLKEELSQKDIEEPLATKEEENSSLVINENDKLKQVMEHQDKGVKKRKIIFVILVILLDIIILFGIIASINKLNDKVYKNIIYSDIDLSGMNYQQVANVIEKNLPKDSSLSIRQDNNEIYSINSQEIEFEIDVDKTIKRIFDYGRNSNVIINNYNILKAMMFKHNIEPVYKYNSDKLDTVIKNIDLSLTNRKEDDSFTLDEKSHKLIIKRGVTGNTINYNIEKEKIINAFTTNKLVNLEIIVKEPSELNIEEVSNFVNREPKDAYIDKSTTPYKFVSEVVGYKMDTQKLEQVMLDNKKEGTTFEFELEIIEPKVKLADITYKLYKDKLAGYTTYFDPSQSGRAKNLSIALQYLNGKVIMPGETFSFNRTVGDITTAQGYVPAATFKGGTVVNEIGGGICQTTSTLYNTALMANMEIVERHQHGLPVGYVPPSRDATVYSPVLDFKFKNTRKYPVKIVTSFSWGGTMNISIYGTREETEYDIVLSNKYISTIGYTTKYIYDETMPEGEQQIITKGVNGYVSEAYLTKYLNGAYVTSYKLSTDTYNPQQAVVKIGTLSQ